MFSIAQKHMLAVKTEMKMSTTLEISICQLKIMVLMRNESILITFLFKRVFDHESYHYYALRTQQLAEREKKSTKKR